MENNGFESYNITDKNISLIANLLYLEECIDSSNMKDKKHEDFYDKFFPYTIMETIQLLIDSNITSGSEWKNLEEGFYKKYGSIQNNTFYNHKEEKEA